MKELSLNVLDIAQNSIKAEALQIDILIVEDENSLTFTVTDDGKGMTREFLENVTNPFTTTRKTRKVGLGLPLLKMAAEMTGGSLSIESRSREEYEDHGTVVKATFRKDSIDYVPLGDIVGTVEVLVQGIGKENFYFRHEMPKGTVELSTAEMREMLGDVPLNSPDVVLWVREYLQEAYNEVK